MKYFLIKVGVSKSSQLSKTSRSYNIYIYIYSYGSFLGMFDLFSINTIYTYTKINKIKIQARNIFFLWIYNLNTYAIRE